LLKRRNLTDAQANRFLEGGGAAQRAYFVSVLHFFAFAAPLLNT
jgi:hypothetical protein